MSKKEMAKSIVEKIGGPENVVKYTHCVTRLRFVLKNEDKIDEEGLKSVSGVMGVVNRGGSIRLLSEAMWNVCIMNYRSFFRMFRQMR